MDQLALLEDLFVDAPRQGPGSPATVAQALALCDLDDTAQLAVADIGCGTGASTLQLAQALNASITAVDLLPRFLERLEVNARYAGVADKIQGLQCAMEALPFKPESLDLIWSEGAIYNMGFARGIEAWREFLKPGAVLAVSEITWSHARPAEPLRQFWKQAYPEVDTASNKLRTLENAGYSPLGYFLLPGHCWTTHYYEPLAALFEAFLSRHPDSDMAGEIVAENRDEIALYSRYASDFSYGMYIARRI